MGWQGAWGRAVLCRRTRLSSTARPSGEAEGVGEREEAQSKIEDRDDSGAPFVAHAAPDAVSVGPILRPCGDRGRGGAGQRDADIVVSPTPSPSLLPLMNLGTDERDKRPPRGTKGPRGHPTALWKFCHESQNFNIQVCKNRFSLTRSNVQ